MHKPDFLDRFDRLVAFDAETTGSALDQDRLPVLELQCVLDCAQGGKTGQGHGRCLDVWRLVGFFATTGALMAIFSVSAPSCPVSQTAKTDPPEGWGWCYIDEVFLDLSDRATPQLGPIPRY